MEMAFKYIGVCIVVLHSPKFCVLLYCLFVLCRIRCVVYLHVFRFLCLLMRVSYILRCIVLICAVRLWFDICDVVACVLLWLLVIVRVSARVRM